MNSHKLNLTFLFVVLTGSSALGGTAFQIHTGEQAIDDAAALASRTLRHNSSEKWGTICPVLAPAWSKHYAAWIHPFDNFWMNRVTPYLFSKKAVAWPIELMARYQLPTGMFGWGIHDTASPEAVQANYATWTRERMEQFSIDSRYIRDHLVILQIHDLWMSTGDATLMKKLLPHCLRSLTYLFTLKDSDGDELVETANIFEDIDVLHDGKPSGPRDVERFVDQSLTYAALLCYAEMCQAAGESTAARDALARAARIKKLSNELFWHDKGYYVFAIDTKTHKRIHEKQTSTYANGYAILYGLAEGERVDAILDYMESWDFEVPGPVLIPPFSDVENRTPNGTNIQFKPGYYANGGCGWGRGHMPSVTLASFRNGRVSVGVSHLRKMARAANKAGAFYEFWTWEKYRKVTEPGGCRDYSETASAYLDATIHGLFGIEVLAPGFSRVRIAPRMPGAWEKASVNLPLLGEGELGYEYTWKGGVMTLVLHPGKERKFDFSLAREDLQPQSLVIEGKKVDFRREQQRELNLCEFSLTATAATTIQVSWE